jgi:ABC-type amino acid transport substrate-binding protein
MRRLLALLFCFCSCEQLTHSPPLRVGVDSNWYSVDLYGQEAYVNGYLEELLVALSEESGLHFERIHANADALLPELAVGRYDVVISGLFPHPLYQTRYTFSPRLLNTGLMLLLPPHASPDLSDKIIGVQSQEANHYLQQHPNVIIHTYESVPELLSAVVSGEADGALLSRIPAINYVRDLYANALEISGEPLTEAGIRFVAMKGEHKKQLALLDKSIEKLEKRGKIKALQEKWRLATK